MSSIPPLAVDLDGTLVNTDLFFESAIWYIRKNPLRFFQICWWFVTKGRAELKMQIEKRVALPISNLPFNQNTIQWLRNEKEKGRELVLVTGTSQKYAKQVAEHLDLFSQVFGVCRERPRLTGKNKLRFLVKRYGEKNFDYIGNSLIDLAVWRKARKCIVANAFPIVIQTAQKRFDQVQIILEPFSFKENWYLFKECLSVLILRICVFIIPMFFVFAENWTGIWIDPIFNAGFILLGILLFYATAVLLGELKVLGPNRTIQQNGIFVFIQPYWGLLVIPLLIIASFYMLIMYDLILFPVWWFLIYFILECMRWVFRKYYLYYDAVLTFVLWMLGLMTFNY